MKNVLKILFLLTFAFSARADWLWWTLDFTYDWGNEGQLNSNPAGSGAAGFDVYLVARDVSGKFVMSVKGGELTDDYMVGGDGNYVQQTDISGFESDAYSFFVELVKSGQSAESAAYSSPDYSYSSLVQSGHVAETIEAVDVVWNPAVGAPWSIPEPSGGTLSIFALTLLMLRRRKRC